MTVNPPQLARAHGRAISNPVVQDGIDYAYDIVEGKILACKVVVKACERFIEDLHRAEEENPPFIFSTNRAQHVLDFVSKFCVHVKGKRWRGKPIDLMDFHVFILVNIFGFVKPHLDEITGEHLTDDSGTLQYVRRFSHAVTYLARKNAKSAIASAVGLYMTEFDGEGGAEVYSAATTREQARIVFDDAAQMVKASLNLQQHLKTTDKSIFSESSYSRFMHVSADANSLDGKNVHCALIDEIHAHKTRDVYDVMETATGSRDQPLIFVISTAGVILDGIAIELKDYGMKILDKRIEQSEETDSFFFIWYTMDEEDMETDEVYRDPTLWFKANPALGVSKSIQDMKVLAKKALEQPSSRNNFQTKHLNIFVNGAFSWMDMQKYGKLKKSSTIKHDLLATLPYIISVDLAEKIDICAAVKTYWTDKGGLAFFSKFWLPEGRLDTCSDEMRERYERWAAYGWLKLTSGDAIDIETIKSDLIEWVKGSEDNLQEMAYDPWHATQFAISMNQKHGWQVVEVPQNVRNLNEAMKHIEGTVYSNKMYVDENEAFTWMMGNVNANRDRNGNIFPDKSSREYKIDGPSALFTGVSRIIRHTIADTVPEMPDNMGSL